MRSADTHLDRWLARLESISPIEIVLGLDRIQVMLQRLGLQLPDVIFVVGGTNGKGSTVAMLDALLSASGLRVGSYFSPHILRYNERIQVTGRDATDAEIVAAFERIEALREDVPLTYFEYGTLAALDVFAAADLDAIVLEVGMGGRLDAVNAVEPTASLISNVALDHCAFLGDDLETIGREKAGIMRPGKPTVFAGSALPASVLEHAAEIGAELLIAGRDYRWELADDRWHWIGSRRRLQDLERPSLVGEIQVRNAAGALALLEASGFEAPLEPAVVGRALGGLELRGRMQALNLNGNWFFDVAHNPAAAKVLATTLGELSAAATTVAIIGMLDDKDVEGVALALDPRVDHWIALTASGHRAIPAAELARRIANATDRPCLAAESVAEAIDRSRSLAGEAGRILVTGSFYIVGPVLEALH